MSARFVLDWRGGNPDFTKKADWYSCASTTIERPVLGNHAGRVLVQFQPCVLFDGLPPAEPENGYNFALWEIAEHYKANTKRLVWQGLGGWHTELIDITKRGLLPAMIDLLDEFFPWADGFQVDPMSNFSWQFPDLEPLNAAWDSVLGGFARLLRSKGKIVLSEQFHLTDPVMASSGLYLEQSPYAFGYTIEKHSADLKRFRDLMAFAKDPREILWVTQIQDYQRWDPRALAAVVAWADSEGIAVALGRDGTAAIA